MNPPPGIPCPVVLPRPANQGPVPSEQPGFGVLQITPEQLEREKWLAFNSGYNEGFSLGYNKGVRNLQTNPNAWRKTPNIPISVSKKRGRPVAVTPGGQKVVFSSQTTNHK